MNSFHEKDEKLGCLKYYLMSFPSLIYFKHFGSYLTQNKSEATQGSIK